MGRVKLNLELISKEKSRNTTFQKRKKGLKKKSYEFSTLCGVDACLIIYGPKHGDRPVEPEIWPENSDEVLRIINRYKEHSKEEREKRNLNLSSFFEDRKKKAEEELSKLRQKNDEANYSLQTWDGQFNAFNEDQLSELDVALDSKLEVVKTRIGSMKGKQDLLEQVAAAMIEYSSLPQQNQNPSTYIHGVFQRSMGLDDMHQQPLSLVKPLDHRFPNDYPYDQTLMYNASSMAAPMMNGMDYTQFSGRSSSNLRYHPPLEGPVSYNSTYGKLEKMEFNNGGPSTCYHTSSVMPMAPYPMCPMTPSIPSQLHPSQFNEFYDFQDFQMKHKMPRF